MKYIANTLLILIITLLQFTSNAQKNEKFKSKKVYYTKSLIVTQISKNAFLHTSFKQTDDFGYVPCNGLVVRNGNETIVFDTPTNDNAASELIKWIRESMACKIIAVIPTHFHDDCLGGLQAFHDSQIPSFANFKTIVMAKKNNMTIPQNSFSDSLFLNVGRESISVKFLGEGHTLDNVVAYFPSENVLFGGCMIKELKATKGYLGDANLAEWSNTVARVKKEFPKVKIVVPGHGRFGNGKLLDYTIALFKMQ